MLGRGRRVVDVERDAVMCGREWEVRVREGSYGGAGAADGLQG